MSFQGNAFQTNSFELGPGPPTILNIGWQVQPFQPPSTTPALRQRYAATRQRTGFAAFSQWQNMGWEVQPPQPPTQPTTKQKYSGALSHLEDGIEAPYIKFFPDGWSIQSVQPPTQPTVNQKYGALSHPEDGIEAPFIPPVVNINWGWEFQLFQPPVQPTIAQRYSGIKGKSLGAVYSPWVNFGWEIQSVQPPNFLKTNQKYGALSHPEDGIEAKFVPPKVITWGYEPFQQALRLQNKYVGGLRGGSQFIGFSFPPWAEIQPFQPPCHINRLQAALKGSDGIPPVTVPLNWGFELQSAWQPPHPSPEKRSAGIMRGDDGIEGTLINFFPYGWEVQPFQPPFSPSARQRYSGIKGKAEFAVFFQWFNFGWEIQAFQPPAYLPTNQKYGALSHPEDGIEAQFIPPLAVPLNWGFELQSGWQPPFFLKTNQKYGALSHPEDGIEGVYVFVPPPPFTWGWDPILFQPPAYPSVRQKYPGTKGKAEFLAHPHWYPFNWEVQPVQPPKYPSIRQFGGIAGRNHFATFTFRPYGWEIQPPQPRYWPTTRQKYGALSHPEDGTEAKFVPPPPIFWGYQPPSEILRRQLKAVSGLSSRSQFIGFFLQPWDGSLQSGFQPPHHFNRPLFKNAEGLEFVFTPPRNVPLNWGFELQSGWQPPHPHPERAAAWLFGDNGIEGIFHFVPPSNKVFEWLIRARRRGRR